MKLANQFLSTLAVVFTCALLTGCSQTGSDKPADAPEKTEMQTKAGVTMDAETQDRIGLKTEAPAALQLTPEMKVYGRVLDPAPLVDLLMELGRAEITYDSSHQELERAKQLKQDNNISERAFQDTATAERQNLAAATAILFKIQSVWGKRIAELTGPIVVAPGTQRKTDELLLKFPAAAVLIRVDLPAGERLDQSAPSARIVPLSEKTAPVLAVGFDKLPTIDPQTQQQGFLLIADQSPTNSLTPGEAVTAFIKTAGEPVSGVVVPASAVLRHEGKGWVYVQTESNQFVRTEIPIDRLMDNGWFVPENLSATNRIVVSGAQTVLSAELSGGGFNTGARD
jgi:multidrug efflux pump subunit AcrA (membrane-fusion protein)